MLACNAMPFVCVCEGKGLRKEEGDGAGELWYNIIKIGWPSQGSTCYCLFNLKKTACINRHVADFFLHIFYKAAVNEFCFDVVKPINIPMCRGLTASAFPQSSFCTCTYQSNVCPL